MFKGMMGGALMVALLAGGAYAFGKVNGHQFETGMGMGMSMGGTHDGTIQHDGTMDHGDVVTLAASNTQGEGVTLAQATAAASEGHEHTEGMTHDTSAMDMDNSSIPTEPGQGAFAAVSEIVKMLVADPDTDWSKVNIAGLREHLVDMDMLITNADVTTVEIDGGIEMTISLSGLGGGAASRMVPAHGPVLAGETGWDSTVELTDNAAIWRVVSVENTDQIRSLGFFGLMAMGDHHRTHHIGMAKGEMVH